MGGLDELVRGHRRALVWGIGGGNDGLNTLPVVVQLARRGIVCDMANSLNPSHHHIFEDGPEGLINRITPLTHKRINDRSQQRKELVDAALAAFLPKLGLGQPTPGYYGLSFKRGTVGLINALNGFIRDQGYDLLVGVDAGGDAFLRGAKDARVLSPIIDAMALYTLSRSSIQSYVVEQGLGTDGELMPEAQRDLVHRWTYAMPLELRAESLLEPGTPEINAYHAAYAAIRAVREGNTARRTLRSVYDAQGLGWSEPHELRAKVGSLGIKTSFPVHIMPYLASKQYWLDPAQQAEYNPLARRWRSALGCAVAAKFLHGLHTDLDLQYIWSGSPPTTAADAGCLYDTFAPRDGKLLQFAALQDPEPVPGIKWLSQQQRATVLQYCAMQLEQGETDLLLVKRQDAHMIPSRVDVLSEGVWTIASHPHARRERDLLAMLMRAWIAEGGNGVR